LAAALAFIATSAVAQPQPASSDATESERLAELGTLWITFEFFSPYLEPGDGEWAAALFEAIPAVRRARTEAELITAYNTMLARSGDPAARIYSEADEAQGAPPEQAVRIEDGVAIANCTSMVASGANPRELIQQMSQAERGVVVDCREFGASSYSLDMLLKRIANARTSQPIPVGGAIVRFYDGFPNETSVGSPIYTTGVTQVAAPALTGSAAATLQQPLVYLIDGRVSSMIETMTGLQAAGLARIVSEEEIGGPVASASIGDHRVLMTSGIYAYPNGARGLHPDVLEPNTDLSLARAIEQLSAAAAPQAPAPGAPPAMRAPARFPGTGAPPVEQRLLALFRYWGTIEFFFPYWHLTEPSWTDTLEEFVPVFIAADTRAEYEEAVLRLSARTQDTHSNVAGLTQTPYFSGFHRPALSVRYIEDKPVVIGVYDETFADRIRVGDEIVAVDNIAVADIERRLTPLIGYSTPQARRLRLADRMLAGPENSVAALRVRGADGRTRTLRMPRVARQRWPSAAPVWRMLEGDVGYINLEELAPPDADRALDELIEARALILDLRGYPQGTAWTLAPRLARRPDPIIGARFSRPRYVGLPYGSQTEHVTFEQEVPPQDARRKFEGPVFVLIDERAVSHSEHSGLFLEAAADVTFVGQPTNGANGDITSLMLPGSVSVIFTGHNVSWPDGRQLQRVGIQPDVPVAPTIAGIRAGRDEVLDAALALARR
jgi:C-terminal processing protease CtpA/Prc